MKKESYDRAMEHAQKYVRNMVLKAGPEEERILGMDAVLITTFLGMGGDATWDHPDYFYDPEKDGDPPEGVDEDDLNWPGIAIEMLLKTMPKDSYFEYEGYN